MSKMDDIENETKWQDKINAERANNDSNTNEDAQLYRTPESDVGNMKGENQPPGASKVDSIDATPPTNSPDSAEQEKDSKVDSAIAKSEVKEGGFAEKELQRREATKDDQTIDR